MTARSSAWKFMAILMVAVGLSGCIKKGGDQAAPAAGSSAQGEAGTTAGTPGAPAAGGTAKIGGTFNIALSAEPETLNPINSSDLYASTVQGYIVDGLLTVNVNTYDFEPGLAEKWEISPDGLTYTFILREGLKWHDGKPITSEDVKFSFDSVKDPAFKAAHRLPYYENIDSVEAVDPRTIKIKTKKKYYMNLMVMGSGGYTRIIPKHIYGDPKKKLNKEIHGSGPYKIETYNRGKNIILVRDPSWWGFQVPNLKDQYNFERLNFRFVKEENLEIEMLKKGQLDYMRLGNEAYMKKTEGAPFGDTVHKYKVENSDPSDGYGFVAWNLKRPLFQDKKVRVALAHLMNREEMNAKFRYNMSAYGTGPLTYVTPFYPQEVKPILFDLAKAKQLLKEAGWEDQDQNGTLEKTIDGKKTEFRFTFLFSNRDVEKYFTLYKEDLKKAGVQMEIKLVEWNTFLKSIDDRNFDAVALGWGGGVVESDLKQIWHSEAARPGGSNFVSYSNPEVDKVIDQAREELDQKKRWALWQKAHILIAEDAPYAWMFNPKFQLYAVNKRIGRPKDTFKFDIGTTYWWEEFK